MKLLFVHDIKTLLYENDVFARSYGITIWSRYLKVFDEILVCARSRKVSSDLTRNIDKLNCEHVTLDSRIGMFKGPEVFFSRRIKRILKENISKSDGIIVRLDSFLGLMAIKECLDQNKPYIVEVVGCAWDSFWNHGVTGKIIAPFMFYFMKRAVKISPYTIYVTKEFLQKRYPTNGISTNISNVSLPAFNEDILRLRLQKIEALNEDSIFHLMTAANVGVRYKGFQYVIKALGLIKRKNGSCRFYYHVVGEGDQSYLRKIAKQEDVEDNIIFHGGLSHSNVFQMLTAIDIYIQPSLQEGLPRALIEAMSYGLPSIGTKVAGIPELLDSQFLYTKGYDMPSKISKILLRFDKRKMRKAAIENFEIAKEFDSKILSQRRTLFLKGYAECIKK